MKKSGDWWIHADPPGTKAKRVPHEKVQCDKCGMMIATQRMVAHYDKRRCQMQQQENELEKRGFVPLRGNIRHIIKGTVIEKQAVRVKKLWVPAWVPVVYYTIRLRQIHTHPANHYIQKISRNDRAQRVIMKGATNRVVRGHMRRCSDTATVLLCLDVDTLFEIAAGKRKRADYKLYYQWLTNMRDTLRNGTVVYEREELDEIEKMADKVCRLIEKIIKNNPERFGDNLFDYQELAFRRRVELTKEIKRCRGPSVFPPPLDSE